MRKREVTKYVYMYMYENVQNLHMNITDIGIKLLPAVGVSLLFRHIHCSCSTVMALLRTPIYIYIYLSLFPVLFLQSLYVTYFGQSQLICLLACGEGEYNYKDELVLACGHIKKAFHSRFI